MIWRTTGYVDYPTWKDVVAHYDSPLKYEGQAAWKAAGDLSALALAMMIAESKLGTDFNRNSPDNLNALNLRPENGVGYLHFESWTAGIRTWYSRITSATYKQGVYARTTTLEELITVYAPPNDDNNVQEYVDNVVALLRSWPRNLPGGAMADLVFGRVSKPSGSYEAICAKPYDGAGFTRLDHARNVVGRCGHITDGDGSLDFYHTFFATGGERALDALVDIVIARDGKSVVLNPFYGTRMPWANGGSDGLEGDGPLFVRTLGVGMINEGLISMERVGIAPGKMTDAQLETSAHWVAYIFDHAQVPWNSFPLNPHVGIVTDTLHFEFALKPCPGSGMIAQVEAEQNRARAIMKTSQEGGNQAEVPPPTPIEQDHDKLPPGIDWALVESYFGVGVLKRVGKRDTKFKFHRGRVWSEAYVARAVKEQVWPEVEQWNQYKDSPTVTREIITFKNGWTLVKLNAREGWRWA